MQGCGDTVGTKIRPKRQPTLKQQKALEAYLDPRSPAHGNKTRAVVAAGYNVGGAESAGSQGYEVFNSPVVQSAMQEMLETQGFGRSVRVSALRNVALAPVMVTKIRDKDGKVTGSYERHDPRMTLRAIDIANKADGSYRDGETAADLRRTELERKLQEIGRKVAEQVERRRARQDAGVIARVVSVEAPPLSAEPVSVEMDTAGHGAGTAEAKG